MKNILLPTDFSENARNAINYALKFFKNELCTFYILHVEKASSFIMDDLMVAPANTSIHNAVTKETKKKLKSLIEELKELTSDQNYSFFPLTDYDVFTDAIQQVVDSKDIHLIIMGTNGATGAKEVIFGSNTLNVIHKVDCPIITVPKGYLFVKPKTVLYTIDYNNHFTTKGIQPLMDALIKFKASLRVLKIKEDDTVTIKDFEDKKNMKMFFKDLNHTFHSITNIPTVFAIDNFVQIMHVDLNAMFIHRKTFLERFFQGSDTSKISYGTRVPLLIMRS